MEEKIRSISKCQCSGCGRFFVSAGVFDEHFTGKFADGTWRCKTFEEMRASGLATEKRNVRMIREGKEYFELHRVWYSVEGRERVRQAFGHGDAEDEVEEEAEEHE
jgi:hypothetical protein